MGEMSVRYDVLFRKVGYEKSRNLTTSLDGAKIKEAI